MPETTAPINHLIFANPNASRASGQAARIKALHGVLLPTGATYRTTNEIATVAAVQQTRELQQVTSDGGDGTVRLAIAALAGVVPNDPEATAANADRHRKLAESVRFFALGGGDGCNWPQSAHGRYALRPEKIARGDWPFAEAVHYPLYYEIHDAEGQTVASDIAISGIGIQATARAARAINEVKASFTKEHSAAGRFMAEARVTPAAILNSPPIDAKVTYFNAHGLTTEYHENVLGLEWSGTHRYAKVSRTAVNVDDSLWQPSVLTSGRNRAATILNVARTILHANGGYYERPPIDMQAATLTVEVEDGGQAVPYHVDGDWDESKMLQSGQSLVMRQLGIPIHTLVLAS